MSSVTLWPDKFHFCRRSITFSGYFLGWEGYQPSRNPINSITNFTMPAIFTITALQSWFGLVNQVAPFLLRSPSGKAVYWNMQLEVLYTSAKDTIGQLAAEGLCFYDVLCPTAVLTDYSHQAIGFLQQYCECLR